MNRTILLNRSTVSWFEVINHSEMVIPLKRHIPTPCFLMCLRVNYRVVKLTLLDSWQFWRAIYLHSIISIRHNSLLKSTYNYIRWLWNPNFFIWIRSLLWNSKICSSIWHVGWLRCNRCTNLTLSWILLLPIAQWGLYSSIKISVSIQPTLRPAMLVR